MNIEDGSRLQDVKVGEGGGAAGVTDRVKLLCLISEFHILQCVCYKWTHALRQHLRIVHY